MVHHLNFYTRAYSSAGPEREITKKEARCREAWSTFRKWWNGPPASKGANVHFAGATGQTCRMYVATMMAKSLAAVMFMTLPSKPEAGKWTKTPPAVDWFNNIASLSNVLPDLIEDAYKHIVIKMDALDGVPASDLSFQQATGVRLAGARKLVKDNVAHHALR